MSRSRIIAGKAVIVVEVLDHVQKGIRGIQSSMHKVANAATLAGEQAFRTGFFGSIISGAGIRQFAKFEDSLLFMQTKLGIFGKAVGKDKMIMDDLEYTIRELGRTTSFTSTEVAEGAARLAQGGLTYKEIKNTLGSLLDLSRASRTELTMTADALIRSMRAFNIPTEMAETVASQFVRATRAGTLDLEDLRYALQYSQGTAASLQQTLPVMLALFAEMSNKGLAGSVSGTSMNTAMAQIAKKMEDLQGSIAGFGPIWGPNGFDFPATLKLLFQLTAHMDVLKRKAIFQDIFNLRGERAATAVLDIDSVMRLADAIGSVTDEARKASDTMDQGIGGAIRIALSAFEEFGLRIGKAASGPLTNMLRVFQELSNRLGDMVNNNSALATFILFSPGILLAAVIGLIGFAKGLRLVAMALGVVRSSIRGIGIPMVQGLLTGASQLGAATGAAGRGISNASSRGSTILASTKTIRANKAALPVLQKQFRYEKLLFKMMIQRGVASRQQLAMQGRIALRAKQAVDFNLRSTRLATGARSAAMNVGGMKGFISGMMSLRRFIPSWWTIIDILILFGDKIPVVSTILSTFGKAFSAAFSEIGKAFTYFKGPMELFRASSEAITAGHVNLGIKGISTAIRAMAAITKNQLVAAWERFKAVLGTIWSTIRGIGVSIWKTLEAVVTGIGSIIETTFNSIGDRVNTFKEFFGFSKGDATETTLGVIQGVVGMLGKAVIAITLGLAIAVEKMTALFDNLISAMEKATWALVGALTGADTSGTQDALDSKIRMRTKESDKKIGTLTDKMYASFEAIDNGFKDTSKASHKVAQGLNDASKSIAMATYDSAYAVREFVRRNMQQAEQTITNTSQSTPGSPALALQEQQTLGNAIASTMVGYGRDIQRNIIQYGKTTEEQQLEVMKGIKANQERQMRQSDGILMPMTP